MKRSELRPRPTTSAARPRQYSSTSSLDGSHPPTKEVLKQEILETKLDVAIPAYHKAFSGSLGKRVKLLANCYPLQTNGGIVHLYESVLFMVEQDGGRRTMKNRQAKRVIFWDFMEHRVGADSLDSIVYDDESYLYTTERLFSEFGDLSGEYEYRYDKEGVGRFNLLIKFTYKYAVEIPRFDDRERDTMAMSPNVQNFLNLLVTQIVRLPCTDIEAVKRWLAYGSSVISVGLTGSQQYGPVNLDFPYKLYQGILTKVKSGERARPYLNIGLVHEVMIALDMCILDFYARMLMGRDLNDDEWEDLRSRRMSYDQKANFDNILKGIEITTEHGRKRHYEFVRLADHSAREMYIEEKKMTVEEYFRKQYNIKLKYPQLPLVNAKMNANRPAYIPIELCRVPIRRQKKRLRNALSTRVLARICQLATKTPTDYFKQKHIIAEENRIFGNNTVMEEFGVCISREEIGVNGRVITAPTCSFGEDDLRSRVVEKPDEFYIAVCKTSYRQDHGMMQDFIHALQNELDSCNLRYRTSAGEEGRNRQIHWDDCVFKDPNAVEDYMHRKANEFRCTVDLILFVFLIEDTSSYRYIKTAGDLLCGTSTQCINVEKFNNSRRAKRQNAYMKGVAAKIVVRLGGVTNKVELRGRSANETNEAFGKFTKQDGHTMFVGMYSAKTPNSNTNNTVVSLTYNIDMEATRYATIFYYNSDGEDFCERTEEAFYEVLRRHFKTVGCLPKKLMIIRSGLTDNVLKQIAMYERFQIRKAWRRFCNGIPGVEETYYEHADINILHIGVERKHKMRFIKADVERHHDRRSSSRDVNNNVDKGTVVDSVVTGPEGNDFYLCSHKGLLGTSRPAHYRILKNEWNIVPDDLQALLYCLCHLVGRSKPSVSVPAPLYYAQLVCDRAREYVFREQRDFWDIIHGNVKNFPFFT